ncbi:MAG: NAD(P)-dependent glycerol-3-phosphate dehydrogenase [Candidatus Marinimicrobia bacterium]|jgi:glycerol-3-phosphate dehydrogenase (NAD(P)+)|nr:NAD(P)-dependent glycerol-3-phosphate dehydrogenase [Candidatus Neomarinimicrobiota bacterium]MBT4716223.1 NAD(P)-dependent glycerol-3-phosphate dehydrogenase [Candidatus Neomarinimicrobiota bacterium]MBT4946204.1 NAD(P)-dependent glycerol-3-phosphate dehydrogenase [Candidatus Neomarinimicrobiota bacterium]MBT5269726.1 NAD(P)-dependent glycerol-3-phosphate dehydrogenase [Candidatus Neomarinimicrobiota bacterium]MBT6012077.1 NAD(P)-dependent glycerol-3-phosphate dehydrogenase [Candidatus Neom
MKIAVVGSGSWGMTLAMHLLKNGHDVVVWFYLEKDFKQAQETRELPDFLPGVTLPSELRFTMDIEACVSDKEIILVAIPSHTVGMTLSKLSNSISAETIIVNVAKGIENDSLRTMSQVIAHALPDHPVGKISTLYGPTHAEEVVQEMPSTIVAACADEASGQIVQNAFMSDTLRVYTNVDILGVEYGGSLKNVIAIAAGILAGMGYGDNTLAALLTRGLFEMTRLGVFLGAKEQTFAGLSGMGDLVVTCLSTHSRNRHVGFELGKGRKLKEILAEMKMVAEGINTARSVHQLIAKTGVEMPISEQIFQVLFEEKDPATAVEELMGRAPRRERHSIS